MNYVRTIAVDACHDYAAAQWEAAYDELANLTVLKHDWDGEGAYPARPGLIAASFRLFQMLEEQSNPAPADVYLAPDGTVVIEWHFGVGSTRVINVRTTDRAEVIRRLPNRHPEFSTVQIPMEHGQMTFPAPVSNDPISYLDDGAYLLAR